MEVIRFSDTSVYLLTTRRYIPKEDSNVYNYRCENLTSYVHVNYFVKVDV
jgi:hypothetical protein